MAFHIAQSATATERGWWHWAVWLETDDEILDQVDAVEYILHPTFRDPVKRIKDRASRFRLEANAWGEFLIYVHIYLRDGSVLKKEHWLELRGAPTRGAAPSYAAMSKGLEMADPEIAEATAGPTLFLSRSVSDRSIAARLIEALNRHGYHVLMDEDLDPDVPLIEILRSNPGLVNGALLLVSERSSPYLRREVDALQQVDVPMLPVLVGPDAQVPPYTEMLPPLSMDAKSDMEEVTGEIIARLSGLLQQ